MSDSRRAPLGEAWVATRLSVVADRPFEELVDAFEELVPPYPAKELSLMVEAQASWADIVEFAENYSELGLLTYWHDSVTQMMSLAGNRSRCAFYFVGNFPVAERMYRHDPRVMNYAPLRMTITETEDHVVRFTTDQPSSGFGSFGNPAITVVGQAVDGKLAQLLRQLGLPVPAPLLSTAS